MTEIEKYINELFDLYEDSKESIFSKNISVDKERFNDILVEMRGSVPKEIKEAEKINKDCQEFIDDAKNRAEGILIEAEKDAVQLVSENEIYLRSVDEAASVVNLAEERANAGVQAAYEFVDNLFVDAEELLTVSNTNIVEKMNGMINQVNVLEETFNEKIRLVKEDLNKELNSLEYNFADILDDIYNARDQLKPKDE